MGLLDRWIKRKKQEQLDKVDDQATLKKEKAEIKTVKTVKKLVKAEEKVAPAVAMPVKPEEKKNVFVDKILVKPLVTEKAAVSQSLNKYSFLVSRSANKNQIKQAVKEKYGVKPVAVNVVNVQGKSMRFGRAAGCRSDYRKAVVTLAKGQTITIHEGV